MSDASDARMSDSSKPSGPLDSNRPDLPRATSGPPPIPPDPNGPALPRVASAGPPPPFAASSSSPALGGSLPSFRAPPKCIRLSIACADLPKKSNVLVISFRKPEAADFEELSRSEEISSKTPKFDGAADLLKETPGQVRLTLISSTLPYASITVDLATLLAATSWSAKLENPNTGHRLPRGNITVEWADIDPNKTNKDQLQKILEPSPSSYGKDMAPPKRFSFLGCIWPILYLSHSLHIFATNAKFFLAIFLATWELAGPSDNGPVALVLVFIQFGFLLFFAILNRLGPDHPAIYEEVPLLNFFVHGNEKMWVEGIIKQKRGKRCAVCLLKWNYCFLRFVLLLNVGLTISFIVVEAIRVVQDLKIRPTWVEGVGCLVFCVFLLYDLLSGGGCCRIRRKPFLRLAQLQKNLDKLYAGESVHEVALSDIA